LGNALIKTIAYNSQTITEDLTVVAGTNGLSAGPVEITPGFTVTVEPGATWKIV